MALGLVNQTSGRVAQNTYHPKTLHLCHPKTEIAKTNPKNFPPLAGGDEEEGNEKGNHTPSPP
jgi:hypothetical protein